MIAKNGSFTPIIREEGGRGEIEKNSCNKFNKSRTELNRIWRISYLGMSDCKICQRFQEIRSQDPFRNSWAIPEDRPVQTSSAAWLSSSVAATATAVSEEPAWDSSACSRLTWRTSRTGRRRPASPLSISSLSYHRSAGTEGEFSSRSSSCNYRTRHGICIRWGDSFSRPEKNKY